MKKKKTSFFPQSPSLKTKTHFYTLASALTLDEAAENATKNMVHFIQHQTRLTPSEIITLLSIIGNVQICQIVDPQKTCRFEVSLEHLKTLGVEL